VVVITTKKGARGKGHPVVDLNYFRHRGTGRFSAAISNVYGQGYDRADNIAVAEPKKAGLSMPSHPQGCAPISGLMATSPPNGRAKSKMVDGSIRSYSPQPNNFRGYFQDGFSSTGVWPCQPNRQGSYRISASRLDYQQHPAGFRPEEKHLCLNSSLKLNDRRKVDVIANYVNTLTHNQALRNQPGWRNPLMDSSAVRRYDLILSSFKPRRYKWCHITTAAQSREHSFLM